MKKDKDLIMFCSIVSMWDIICDVIKSITLSRKDSRGFITKFVFNFENIKN